MARVSHELRTPLNAVIGFSDLMGQGLFGPIGDPRYAEYVRFIQDSGRELLKSTEDTLVLTTLLAMPEASGARAALDVRALATEAWASLAERAAARHLRLSVEAPPGVAVLGEARVLRQALVNLFAEAISRAAERTTVVVSTVSADTVVEVDIAVPQSNEPGCAAPSSLHVCLARALLEFEDAALAVSSQAESTWRAVTVLDAAVQQDFFAVPLRL
jgi:two-component system cell cycle sensor histidine kinase PleC